MNPFGNPQKLMKQLQQTQEQMQQEIAALEIEATSGGGMVKVVMDGQKNAEVSLSIDPEVVSKDDVEMLQDLVTAAVNEAARKVDEAIQEKIGGLAGGHEDPRPVLAYSRRHPRPRPCPGPRSRMMKSLLARRARARADPPGRSRSPSPRPPPASSRARSATRAAPPSPAPA